MVNTPALSQVPLVAPMCRLATGTRQVVGAGVA